MARAGPDVEQQAQFRLEDVHRTECADAVERALRAQPHITGLHVGWANNVVHVHYHPDNQSSRY
jgi:cation transport ATPase